MSDIGLAGQGTLYINQSLCSYFMMLQYKTYQKGKIDSLYASNGKIRTKIQENARPVTISRPQVFSFPGVNLSVVM